MPIEMLLEVHGAIFGKTPPLERAHMVDNLMTLFFDTESKYNLKIFLCNCFLCITKSYQNYLKRLRQESSILYYIDFYIYYP